MAWRSMEGTGFGTAELAALKGRRVRARSAVTTGEYLGEGSPIGPPIAIARGRVGFVGWPSGDGVVLAFPDTPPGPQDRLEWLRFGQFRSIRVNVPTLAWQFEIDY